MYSIYMFDATAEAKSGSVSAAARRITAQRQNGFS
jgi:hypothetical protein